MLQDPNLMLNEQRRAQHELERKAERERMISEGVDHQPSVGEKLAARVGDALVAAGERMRGSTETHTAAPLASALSGGAVLHGGESGLYSSGWSYDVRYSSAMNAASRQEDRCYLLCLLSITPSRQSSWSREGSR